MSRPILWFGSYLVRANGTPSSLRNVMVSFLFKRTVIIRRVGLLDSNTTSSLLICQHFARSFSCPERKRSLTAKSSIWSQTNRSVRVWTSMSGPSQYPSRSGSVTTTCTPGEQFSTVRGVLPSRLDCSQFSSIIMKCWEIACPGQ